jgi:hypothetical protein
MTSRIAFTSIICGLCLCLLTACTGGGSELPQKDSPSECTNKFDQLPASLFPTDAGYTVTIPIKLPNDSDWQLDPGLELWEYRDSSWPASTKYEPKKMSKLAVHFFVDIPSNLGDDSQVSNTERSFLVCNLQEFLHLGLIRRDGGSADSIVIGTTSTHNPDADVLKIFNEHTLTTLRDRSGDKPPNYPEDGTRRMYVTFRWQPEEMSEREILESHVNTDSVIIFDISSEVRDYSKYPNIQWIRAPDPKQDPLNWPDELCHANPDIATRLSTRYKQIGDEGDLKTQFDNKRTWIHISGLSKQLLSVSQIAKGEKYTKGDRYRFQLYNKDADERCDVSVPAGLEPQFSGSTERIPQSIPGQILLLVILPVGWFGFVFMLAWICYHVVPVLLKELRTLAPSMRS